MIRLWFFVGWHFFFWWDFRRIELVVDFFHARFRSDDLDIQVRLTFGVWAYHVFDDSRADCIHQVSATIFAISLHATSPRPQTRIGSSDVHLV